MSAPVATNIFFLEPQHLDERPPPPVSVPVPSRPFPGISHSEALRREVPPTWEILKGAVGRGALGVFGGLPESFKSYFALGLGHAVAAGDDTFMDLPVEVHGPVGFWWEDDPTADELRRLQEYARLHGYTGDDLPIRWHLNEHLQIPRDLAALRAEIEREGQVLVVIDSLYKVVKPGVKLSDEEVGSYFAQITREVCDPTNCTVAVIDHRPWPTESNRGQARPYGSVFKAAAVRWGIYFERVGKTDRVWITAGGNNVLGFARKQFTWDAEALQLRPVESRRQAQADAELDQRVWEYIIAHPGCSTNEIERNVTGQAKRIREALERLQAGASRPDARDDFNSLMQVVPTTGTRSDSSYWKAAPEAGLKSSLAGGTTRDDSNSSPSDGASRPAPAAPVRGAGTTRPEGSVPLPGDDTFVAFIRERLEAGHLTETEHAELVGLHRLVAA